MKENNKIQKSVWEVLDSINISFGIDDTAERADIEYLKILHEGEEEQNLDKIYEFIEAAERGSQSIGDSRLPTVLKEAYKADAIRLFQFIEGKNNLVDYWVFLSLINDREILFSFAEMQSQNVVFHYECARQILIRFSYNEGYEIPCEKSIVQFARRDIELWRLWIKRYENSSKWTKIAWNVLSKLEAKEILEYSNNINLLTCSTNGSGRNIQEGFNNIDPTERTRIMSIISDNICERWEITLKDSKTEGRYQNGILFSDYTCIILSSMNVMFCDNSLWIEQLKKYACLLESDLHKWYSSEKKYFSSFFLNLTNIYYLLVIKEDNLNSLVLGNAKFSVELIQFILFRYEYFWKFNGASVIIKHIESLLGQIVL